MDLCACICAQIQQHLQTVQQILNGLSNGPPVITQSVLFSSSSTSLSLDDDNDDDVSLLCFCLGRCFARLFCTGVQLNGCDSCDGGAVFNLIYHRSVRHGVCVSCLLICYSRVSRVIVHSCDGGSVYSLIYNSYVRPLYLSYHNIYIYICI